MNITYSIRYRMNIHYFKELQTVILLKTNNKHKWLFVLKICKTNFKTDSYRAVNFPSFYIYFHTQIMWPPNCLHNTHCGQSIVDGELTATPNYRNQIVKCQLCTVGCQKIKEKKKSCGREFSIARERFPHIEKPTL